MALSTIYTILTCCIISNNIKTTQPVGKFSIGTSVSGCRERLVTAFGSVVLNNFPFPFESEV